MIDEINLLDHIVEPGVLIRSLVVVNDLFIHLLQLLIQLTQHHGVDHVTHCLVTL